MDSSSEKNDKYAFLYDYAKSSFENELQRFKNIEDKAAKYIGFLSLLIVAYSALIKSAFDLFVPADTPAKVLAFIVVSFTFLSLVSSWSLIFRALGVMQMPRMPFDQQLIDDFAERSLPTMHYDLSMAGLTAKNLAREVNIAKITLLSKGHRDICVSAWSVAISVVMLVILKL